MIVLNFTRSQAQIVENLNFRQILVKFEKNRFVPKIIIF